MLTRLLIFEVVFIIGTLADVVRVSTRYSPFPLSPMTTNKPGAPWFNLPVDPPG
jgi:hypothetical protein